MWEVAICNYWQLGVLLGSSRRDWADVTWPRLGTPCPMSLGFIVVFVISGKV